MNIIEKCRSYRSLIITVALCVLATACGRDQIFGSTTIAAALPSVTAETPANGAVGVLVSTASI